MPNTVVISVLILTLFAALALVETALSAAL